MMAARFRTRQHGLSLVELAVVMAIIGVIGVFAWRWLEGTRQPLQRPAMMGQLAQAQAAVEGFVLAQHRLPCSASTSAGNESCADATAVLLPWRTLGLGSSFSQLHYGVNRGGTGLDLAVTAPAFVRPNLGVDFSALLPIPAGTAVVTTAVTNATGAITAATNRDNVVNGLDWCRVLRRYAANPTVANTLRIGTNNANEIPVAYVLVHAGVNGVFEGNNASGGSHRFDFPGRTPDPGFDDLAIAVGPADLSARIGCVARLSESLAAAQGAYAAYDTARVVREYWSLLIFDIEQAESAVQNADTAFALATMNAAIAAGSAALAIASAANTEAATVFGIALSIASVAAAATELGFAITEQRVAGEELVTARAKEAAVHPYVAHVLDSFSQALNAAVLRDTKGLNP